MPTSQPSLLRTALFALLAALLLWLCISTAWTGLTAHWPGLFTDMWDEMPFLQRLDTGQSTLHDWLNAYAGSHRLLLPRAVFALEHSLFRHGNVFTPLVSLLFHAATVALVYAWVMRHEHASTLQKTLLASTVLAAGLSSLHLHNLLYTFLVQWFQVVFFSLAGFALMVRAAHLQGIRQALAASAALMLVLLAGFCTFAGAIALIALAWLALALPLPRRLRFALLTTSLLAVVLHVASLESSSTLAQSNLLPLLPAALLYTFRFLGTPLTLLWEPAGIALGAVLWLYTLAFALRCLWKKPGSGSLPLFALTGLLWLCGCAMAIALGRGSAPITAVAERFHTLHLWLWPLWVLHLSSLKPLWLQRLLPLLLLLFLCIVLVPTHQQALSKTLDLGQRVRMAHIAYALDMRDWRTHALLSVPHKAAKQNPALIWRDYLQATENGLFAQAEAQWPFNTVPARDWPDCASAGHSSLVQNPVSETHSLLRLSAEPLPTQAWVIDNDGRVRGYLLPALPEHVFQNSSELRGYSEKWADLRIINPVQTCVMATL